MSKKSVSWQQFQIKQSLLLTRFLFILHSLAAFASLANGWPWLYQLMILAAIGISFCCNLRRYHTNFQAPQLQYSDEALWSITMTNQPLQAIKILPSSVITVWLIVLHFQLENGKFHSLLILTDALSPKDYRAVTVLLKITC